MNSRLSVEKFKEFHKIYSQQEIADLENYWRSTGWDESQGMPKIVVMKWTGNDELRANATKRFVTEGRYDSGAGVTGLFAGAESFVRTGDGPGVAAASGQGRTGDAGRDIGGAGFGSGTPAPDRLAAVARELLRLPDAAVENLGVDPSRLDPVRQDFGIFR